MEHRTANVPSPLKNTSQATWKTTCRCPNPNENHRFKGDPGIQDVPDFINYTPSN